MLYRSHVMVCGGTGCTSSDSDKVAERFTEEIKKAGLDKEVLVVRTGCFGLCELGPVVVVYPEGVFYSRVKPDYVPEIVEEHLLKGRPVKKYLYGESVTEREIKPNVGSMMGSGGLVVMDEDTCMVNVAKFFLEFTVDESCGKCAPCRIGTRRMLEVLDKITSGKGEEGDIERLEELAKTIKATALCGLGQTAPNPVLSTIRYFRDEYEAHIKEKRCPAGVCQALLRFYIAPDKCKGCGICAKNCPVNAISGKTKEPYVIDQDKCIKCGTCIEKCPFGAIYKK